jgi:hypothetical protein
MKAVGASRAFPLWTIPGFPRLGSRRQWFLSPSIESRQPTFEGLSQDLAEIPSLS